MLSRLVRSYLYVFRHYPALIGMGAVVIVVQFGWSAAMGVLPLYFKHTFAASPELIGVALLAFLGTETLLKPPLGHLGDRVGRKLVIMAGCALAAAATLLEYFTDHWYWFLPLMALNGVAAAAIWPAVTAYMAERVRGHDKAAAMSVFEGGYLVGFGLGGAFGLYLGGVIGNRLVFLVTGVTFVLSLFAALILVSDGSVGRDGRHAEGEREPQPLAQLAKVGALQHAREFIASALALIHEAPMLFRLMFVYVMSQCATTALAPIMTLYGEQELGRSQEEMAMLFIAPALVVALVGVAMGRLADRMGKQRAVLLCYLAASSCLFLLYAARTPEPGVVAREGTGLVTVNRRQRKGVEVGDVLAVRRQGKTLTTVTVASLSPGAFRARVADETKLKPGDRVFVRAHPWQIWLLMIGLTLLFIAYALGAPALLGLGSAVAPPHKQGQALGLMNSAQGVGSVLGIIAGPAVYAHVSPQAPVLMACALYAVCAVFSWLFVSDGSVGHEPHPVAPSAAEVNDGAHE